MQHTTLIEVNSDALAANYRLAASLCGPECLPFCVVKSNAYGHGTLPVAQALARAGARAYAVACTREGLLLRRGRVDGDILVMGRTGPEALPRALEARLTLSICCREDALSIDAAARAADLRARTALKIDVGFHRLGFDAGEAGLARTLLDIAALPGLLVTDLYAHLGLRSARDDGAQAAAFDVLSQALEKGGLSPRRHLLDSIGLLRYPAWRHGAVRVGALLYGLCSRDEPDPDRWTPALRFYARVTQLHRVPRGGFVGYEDRRPLRRDTVVATLGAGYGDGYPRLDPEAGAHVLLRGVPAPVLGPPCMDQMMVDATEVPGVAAGDLATLWGGALPVGTVAGWAGVNRNAVLAGLSARPPRLYVQSGEPARLRDDLLAEEETLWN